MSTLHDQAWTGFWARNPSGGGGDALPAAWERIVAAQIPLWQRFAAGLPRNARVLDLATGDGRVMHWLLGARRDLKPTGVDLAPQLPPPPKGTKMRPGIRMEALPFGPGQFAAATSQFGLEYGDVPRVAAELARILPPQAPIAIMTHRRDGPILAHNLARREQLHWALEEQGLLKLARQALALRILPPRLAAAPAQAAQHFGQASAAWDIAEAIRQTMVMGAGHPPAHIAQTLDLIADRAANELARIASLEAACAATADDQGFVEALRAGGLAQQSCDDVCEAGGGRPFAHFRVLRPS